MPKYSYTATVQKFSQPAGWHYARLNVTHADLGITKIPRWGLVPARITVGNTTWEKSLLPYGDGTLFVALSAKIRKKENISLGDTIQINVTI